MGRLTDKTAIRVALLLARDYEKSLIDAYRDEFTGKVDERENGVTIARHRIAAFERVLDRYYPNWRNGTEMERALAAAPSVNIMDLMKPPRHQEG